MKSKEKLIVLCFEVQDVEIHVFDIDSNTNVNEEYIRKLGFNVDYCQWSFGTSVKFIIN